MLQEETEAQRREAYSMSRLRSSSIEIREKGTEFLREQLDAAQKVPKKAHYEQINSLAHIFLIPLESTFYFILLLHTEISSLFTLFTMPCNAE